MSRIFESQPHIQEVTEQYRLRSPKGINSIDDMVSNLAAQVEFAEMIERMGRNVLGGQTVVQASAERYGQRLPRIREQMLYAIKLRDRFVTQNQSYA